jgi:hypothetical protein
MIRKTLNASQLQQEVDRRIHRLQAIIEDGVKIHVPAAPIAKAGQNRLQLEHDSLR